MLRYKSVFIGKQRELLGKLNLAPLEFSSYIPHTSSSLNYSTLNSILNDVVLNQRKEIIEFGTGISTLYVAKLARVNNIKLRIVSIDNSEAWLTVIQDILSKEQLAEFVECIHSPLVQSDLSLEGNTWFDVEPITAAIQSRLFDQVIVDGPMAHTRQKALSRYPALPFIKQYLAEKHAIILDDTNRKGEQKIIHLWEQQFGYDFRKLNRTARIAFAGKKFNII